MAARLSSDAVRDEATLWLPAIERGELVRRRQVVEFVDHGTGTGRELGRLFDVSGAVDLGSTAAGEPVDPLVVELRPFDHPEGVEVVGSWDGRPRPCRRAALGEWVLRMVTRHHLDRNDGAAHLHAAAVAGPDGRALVALGSSGAGKSTLAAHLVDRGLALVTDEQVELLDAGAAVGGFTRPLSVEAGGVGLLPPIVQERLAAQRTSAAPGTDALVVPAHWLGGRHRVVGRPVVLVLLDRGDDHGAPTLDRLEPAEAFESLCANNLDLTRSPSHALECLARLAVEVPAVTLRYRDAAEAAGVLADLLEHPPTRAVTSASGWSVRPIEPSEVAAGWRPSPGLLTVVLAGTTFVFHPRTRSLVRFNAAGGEAWDDLVAGRSPGVGMDQDLVDDLVARGLLGDPRDLTSQVERGAHRPSESAVYDRQPTGGSRRG